jgi:hypothetical protein
MKMSRKIYSIRDDEAELIISLLEQMQTNTEVSSNLLKKFKKKQGEK